MTPVSFGWRPIRRPTPTVALLGLGLLSVGLYWACFYRPFPLDVHYQTPLLSLFKLTVNQPSAWYAFLVGVAGLNLAYLAGFRRLSRARTPVPWWIVLLFPAVALLLLLFTYPVGAADVFDYLARGQVRAAYGANPYVQVPAQFADDALMAFAAWPKFPSAYGPLWELVAAPLASWAHGDLWRGVLIFKGQAVLSLVVTAGAVAALAFQSSRERTTVQLAVFAVLWNPLLLFEIGANGHHDLWLAFGILIATWLALHQRYGLALVALTAATLFKFVSLLLIPVFVVAALRQLGGRRGLRQLLAGGMMSLVLVVLCYAPFWPMPDPLRLAQRAALYTTSLPAVVRYVLQLLADPATATGVAGRLAFGLLALIALVSIVAAWLHPRPAPWHTGRNLLVAALLVATAWYQAWYVAWVLPLAAWQPRSRALRGTMLLSVLAWFKYVLFDLTYGLNWQAAPRWQREVAAFLIIMLFPIGWYGIHLLRQAPWKAWRVRWRASQYWHSRQHGG